MKLNINMTGDPEAIVGQLRSTIYRIETDDFAQQIFSAPGGRWQGLVTIDPETETVTPNLTPEEIQALIANR